MNGANSVVASDIPPYTVAAGNPCRVIRKRFDEELIAFLLDLKWWDCEIEKIEENFEALSSGNLSLIREIGRLKAFCGKALSASVDRALCW